MRSVRLARQAIAEERREGDVAVAFAIDADIDRADGAETLGLLQRAFAGEPPDLVVVEGLTVVRPSLHAIVETLLAAGLPVWLSFRRCRHGLCGVYGQHWGGPEGDAFGRAARRFEELGVSALLLGASRPTTSPGRCPTCATSPTCRSASTPTAATSRATAGSSTPTPIKRVRAHGARLARGGRAADRRCCGVRAEDRCCAERAGRDAAGAPRRSEGGSPRARRRPRDAARAVGRCRAGARCTRWPSRTRRDEGVFVPSQGSFMIWRHLFGEQIGRAGAAWTSAAAAACRRSSWRSTAPSTWTRSTSHEAADATLLNAFRNGVADRVQRRRRRPLPVDARRALRRHRRLAVPGTGGPARSATRRVRSTTGAATRSTT